jgi:hypothetical protein
MSGEACGSCGRDGEDLETVQRVYLDAPAPGASERGHDATDDSPGYTLTDDIEQWCPTCRLTFPHLPVDPS